MDKDVIKHWLHHQVGRISADAQAMTKDFYPESIHHFRTGTKKLRAVIRLLTVKEDPPLRLPQFFRRLYGESGELRDKQVLLQMLVAEKKHRPPLFAVWLAHSIGETAKELQGANTKRALHRLGEWVAAMDPVVDLLSLRMYYKTKLQRIHDLLTPDAHDEALHEVRKISKDLKYILDWCRKTWEEGYQIHMRLAEPLEMLGEQAGAYNDLRNLLDALDEFEGEHSDWLDKDKDAASAVVAARHDWFVRKARAQKTLLAAIRELGDGKRANGSR